MGRLTRANHPTVARHDDHGSPNWETTRHHCARSLTASRARGGAFWHSAEMRDFLNSSDFTVDDETLVVLEWFELVEALRQAAL